MFDFDFKKNIFLGVDFGTASIKLIELKVSEGKPVLSNYAWMPLSENILGKSEGGPEYQQNILSLCLKQIVKKAKVAGKNVYVSLPAFGGLITLIDFPEMAEGDMEQAIRFEAHKYIPTAIDDVVISWEIVERREQPEISLRETNQMMGGTSKNKIDSGKALKVMLVAASKKKVLKYEKLIKDAGLNLKSIDIETFSVVRSLIGNDSGNFVIVDIGAQACNIVLVEKGIIRINRNIDAGGIEMTKTIAKGMGIDFDRAEALKISGNNFFSTESAISFFTLDLIIGEVERIIRNYYKNNENNKVDKIILTGGTSRMVGITDSFFNKLKIKTVIGNPFARVGYDKNLNLAIEEIGNNFSVAIGLALKGVDEYLEKDSKKNN